MLNRRHQLDVGCHGMPRFRRQRHRYPTSTSRSALPVRIWSIGRDPKGIRSTWGWMTWYWRTPPHTWCVHNSPHTNPHHCWAVPKMDPGWLCNSSLNHLSKDRNWTNRFAAKACLPSIIRVHQTFRHTQVKKTWQLEIHHPQTWRWYSYWTLGLSIDAHLSWQPQDLDENSRCQWASDKTDPEEAWLERSKPQTSNGRIVTSPCQDEFLIELIGHFLLKNIIYIYKSLWFNVYWFMFF